MITPKFKVGDRVFFSGFDHPLVVKKVNISISYGVEQWDSKGTSILHAFTGAPERMLSLAPDQAPVVTTVSGIECMGVMGRHPSGLDTHESLLACPFCGHRAAFRDVVRHTGDAGYHISVECTNTSCAVRTPNYYATRESAAFAWNRRAYKGSPDHQREMAEARAILSTVVIPPVPPETKQ